MDKNEIVRYEICNLTMAHQSSGIVIDANTIWDSIFTGKEIDTWACLFPSGSCIFIQRVMVDDSVKVKYLKCSTKGITTLDIIPNQGAFKQVINREVFNRGGRDVVHYKISLYFPITELYDELWASVNKAYLNDSYILRIVLNLLS